MCLSSFWTALQLLWSSVYVICGTAQLVVGIFFLISVPALHFTSNLVVGFVNVAMGIAGGAIVCFGRLSPRRQEALLYLACSILTVNLAAAILREWGLYFQDYTKILKDHPYHLYILYGCFVTRIAAIAVIVVSFLDSQAAFCSMQIRLKNHRTGPRKKEKNSYDNSADVEFIIPKQKPSKSPSKPHAIYNAYAQSWVFETDHHHPPSNSSADVVRRPPHHLSPKTTSSSTTNQNHNNNNNVTKLSETPPLLTNPVIVRIEEASDDSASNSDRNLYHMKSFSRAASPVILSSASSQLSLSLSQANKPQIYEYLEKLTEPETYRSRLNSALSDKEQEEKRGENRRVGSISPTVESAQHASFMQELQQAISNKKEEGSNSDTLTTNSKSSSSDGDFSRELEAALQLIQDLESPNAAEATTTPSEDVVARTQLQTFKPPAPLPVAPTTAPPPPPPITNGKDVALLPYHPNSQSTSGYSSPTTPQNWSTTSSLSGASCTNEISYQIHNTKCTTVISLYTPSKTETQKGKSVTLVSITGDTKPVDIGGRQSEIALQAPSTTTTTSTSGPNGWRSLLRKTQNKKRTPKLCPELEGAIVKSESLAYLSENELLARHRRNNELHRKIEERVIQQLAVPRTESNC